LILGSSKECQLIFLFVLAVDGVDVVVGAVEEGGCVGTLFVLGGL